MLSAPTTKTLLQQKKRDTALTHSGKMKKKLPPQANACIFAISCFREGKLPAELALFTFKSIILTERNVVSKAIYIYQNITAQLNHTGILYDCPREVGYNEITTQRYVTSESHLRLNLKRKTPFYLCFWF